MQRVAIARFPGSNCDHDSLRAAAHVGAESYFVWHRDTDLRAADVVILPGGFSYGDYLRAGAIARFAPAMGAVARFAADGGPVLGICNGFQVLCEAGLLPGALLPNEGLRFHFEQVGIEVTGDCAWTAGIEHGDRLSIPVKHMTGRYFAPPADLDRLEANGQVVLRYTAGENPNGSLRDIAGVANEAGNVMGLMPHPEHAVDPLTGSTDGLRLLGAVSAGVAVAS